MTKPQEGKVANACSPALTDPAKSWESWPENEKELLRVVAEAVRTIRYGSIVLTIHNGQLVEVSKNIRIRRSNADERA